jgi:hypothetical protein
MSERSKLTVRHIPDRDPRDAVEPISDSKSFNGRPDVLTIGGKGYITAVGSGGSAVAIGLNLILGDGSILFPALPPRHSRPSPSPPLSRLHINAHPRRAVPGSNNTYKASSRWQKCTRSLSSPPGMSAARCTELCRSSFMGSHPTGGSQEEIIKFFSLGDGGRQTGGMLREVERDERVCRCGTRRE